VPAPPLVPAAPVISTQVLFEQVWLAVQQAVPHAVWPPAQLEVQALLLHTWPPWQTVVQFPQWVASDATHAPLQSSMPVGHVHWLAWQVLPPLQAMPQAPQLLESDETSEHPELHIICPPGQLLPVVPALPAALVPAVPGLPFVIGLMQAAAKTERQRPKRDTRALFMSTLFTYRRTS
jgi:hypothetical protein